MDIWKHLDNKFCVNAVKKLWVSVNQRETL